MAKFLDLTNGLPHLWELILGKIETHNTSSTAHQAIRDSITSLTNSVSSLSSNKVDSSTYNTKISSIESSISTVNDSLTTFKNTKGAANGIAPLDSSGKVSSTYLPSYVDDVLEYNAKANFPTTGETGKIYVDKATNLTWRWSGSAYVEISPSLALGSTSSTAYRGDLGVAAANKAQAAEDAAVANASSISALTTRVSTAESTINALPSTYFPLTGKTLGIAQGGTGATTRAGAFTNLVSPGGAITGALKIQSSVTIRNGDNWPYLYFEGLNLSGGPSGIIGYYIGSSNTNSYFEFHERSRSSSDYSRLNFADVYTFPSADADKTANSYYKIITTKNLSNADGRWLRLTGGIVSGALYQKGRIIIKNNTQYPEINFTPHFMADNGTVISSLAYDAGDADSFKNSRFIFTQASPSSSGATTVTGYRDFFYFPPTENGLTANHNYNIYTSKYTSNIFNDLSTGDSTPKDADYFISQYVGGGTTTTTYHRRPMSALWSYVNSKAADTYLKLSGGTITGQLFTNGNLLTNAAVYIQNATSRPCIQFIPQESDKIQMEIAYQGGTSNNNFRIRLYSKKSGTVTRTDDGYYEEYQTPHCDADRTSSVCYTFVTNKNPEVLKSWLSSNNAGSATKLATARTIQTNLGSTSSASFDGTANITPGVTGTLPIANGGTGATTASGARANLGAFSTAGGKITGFVQMASDAWQELYFTTSDGKYLGSICGDDSNTTNSDVASFRIKCYSKDGANYADHYRFPSPGTLTASNYYLLYSTKNIVASTTQPSSPLSNMIWLELEA